MLLSKLLGWAHIPFQCEVFNLFASLIPQDGLSRMEKGRKRQGLVPDFLLEVTSERGAKTMELAELKTISCCPSRYNMAPALPGNQEPVKAVDRRARVLTAEYIKKAVGVDRNYGGVVDGEVGRVQRKLEGYGDVRGLVFGAFGEASQGVHDLVDILALGRIKAVGLQGGRESVKGEMGVLVGQVRRLLSIAAVKSQAECLLSRMRSMGRGTATATKRRQAAMSNEVIWAGEREAQRLGQSQRRKVVRREQFMLD